MSGELDGPSRRWSEQTLAHCSLVAGCAVTLLLSSFAVFGLSSGSAGGAPVAAVNSCSLRFDSPVVAMASHGVDGYWETDEQGQVGTLGSAPCLGSTAGLTLNQPVVGMAATPDGLGYWLVAADGGVFSFGDARFSGSTGGAALNQPVVGMAATPDGLGYWLVAADGGVFSFGDARFFGSTGGTTLNQPVVGMAATPDGLGYWLVAADGGVFGFGDARFLGSTGGTTLNLPVVGMAATPDGLGYWLVAADGGVFSFGNARFFGSVVGGLTSPAVGMAGIPSGAGYRLVTEQGSVDNFGSAPAQGAVIMSPGSTMPCLASQLTGSLGPGFGAAGSIWTVVLLLNRSTTTCSLQGYPQVAYASSVTGRQVGATALHMVSPAVPTVTLSPRGVAQVVVQQFAPFGPPASCSPTPVAGLRLYPPGRPAALFVSQPATRCGSPGYIGLRVGPIVP